MNVLRIENHADNEGIATYAQSILDMHKLGYVETDMRLENSDNCRFIIVVCFVQSDNEFLRKLQTWKAESWLAALGKTPK